MIILTRLPSPLGRPLFFSEVETYIVHFLHNDTLIVTMLSSVKNLGRWESNVNILQRYTLDRMKDTLELARKIIRPQTQLLLYRFDGSKPHSPGTITFPVRADPYNIVIDLCVLDVESSYKAILRSPWIHMMRVVPSTHHQLLKYPHCQE